jgi:hypothetical protein
MITRGALLLLRAETTADADEKAVALSESRAILDRAIRANPLAAIELERLRERSNAIDPA